MLKMYVLFWVDVLAFPYQLGVYAIYNKRKALQNTIKNYNHFSAHNYRLFAMMH